MLASPCEVRGGGGGASLNKVSNSSEVTVEEAVIWAFHFLFFSWKEPFTMKPQLTCSHIARLHYAQMV